MLASLTPGKLSLPRRVQINTNTCANKPRDKVSVKKPKKLSPISIILACLAKAPLGSRSAVYS